MVKDVFRITNNIALCYWQDLINLKISNVPYFFFLGFPHTFVEYIPSFQTPPHSQAHNNITIRISIFLFQGREKYTLF